jgi:hypothetical protein
VHEHVNDHGGDHVHGSGSYHDPQVSEASPPYP